MKLLVLASGFKPQYRPVRCAAEFGEVYVLGSPRAERFRRSRFCREFRPVSFDNLDALATQINAFCAETGIDMILPSDSLTTRALSVMRANLIAKVFPVPDTAAFDALDTKDRFMETCRLHDIPHPAGAIYRSREEVLEAYRAGAVRLPAILKPVGMSGGRGVIRIGKENALAAISAINYDPVLVQDAVDGADICISMFCDAGVVKERLVYFYREGTFHFEDNPKLAAIVERLVKALDLRGVINFDARIGRDGTIWILECNPRFWYNMDVALIAGSNYARFGIMPNTDPPRMADRVQLPHALFLNTLRLRPSKRVDWRYLLYLVRDPVIAAIGFTEWAGTQIRRAARTVRVRATLHGTAQEKALASSTRSEVTGRL